ncbi:MAG: hypothetical protein L6266_04045 [Nanoarchaeota archaeon]|nr:hypothetical protein [Nanoarchaeota archaeon]
MKNNKGILYHRYAPAVGMIGIMVLSYLIKGFEFAVIVALTIILVQLEFVLNNQKIKYIKDLEKYSKKQKEQMI